MGVDSDGSGSDQRNSGFFIRDGDFNRLIGNDHRGWSIATVAVDSITVAAHDVVQCKGHIAQLPSTLRAFGTRHLKGLLRFRIVSTDVSRHNLFDLLFNTSP